MRRRILYLIIPIIFAVLILAFLHTESNTYSYTVHKGLPPKLAEKFKGVDYDENSKSS